MRNALVNVEWKYRWEQVVQSIGDYLKDSTSQMTNKITQMWNNEQKSDTFRAELVLLQLD